VVVHRSDGPEPASSGPTICEGQRRLEVKVGANTAVGGRSPRAKGNEGVANNVGQDEARSLRGICICQAEQADLRQVINK